MDRHFSSMAALMVACHLYQLSRDNGAIKTLLYIIWSDCTDCSDYENNYDYISTALNA